MRAFGRLKRPSRFLNHSVGFGRPDCAVHRPSVWASTDCFGFRCASARSATVLQAVHSVSSTIHANSKSVPSELCSGVQCVVPGVFSFFTLWAANRLRLPASHRSVRLQTHSGRTVQVRQSRTEIGSQHANLTGDKQL